MSILLRVDLHLAAAAVKLQGEASSVGKSQEERIGYTAIFLFTEMQALTNAVLASHDECAARFF